MSLDGADHLLTREADAGYAAEVIAAWASRYVANDPAADEAADLLTSAPTRLGLYGTRALGKSAQTSS